MKIYFSIFLIILLLLPNLCFGSSFNYEQLFNDLNEGALNGQDSWEGNEYIQIQTAVKFEGSKGVLAIGDEGYALRSIAGSDAGLFYIAMRKDIMINSVSYVSLFEEMTEKMNIEMAGTGNINWYVGGGWQLLYPDYSVGEWYVVAFNWDNATHPNQYRVKIYDGEWSNWTDWSFVSGNSYTEIDMIGFFKFGVGNGFWDTITLNDPTPSGNGNEAGLFTLPSNSVSASLSHVSDLIEAIGPFLWLFIGVPLAFLVIKKIIKMMPKK